MDRIAFKMKLLSGHAAEYKKRHDEIWPELSALLKSHGVHQYAIFLDEETNILFATLKVDNAAGLDALPATGIMQKWWHYMADIMETNPDNSPVSEPLTEVFYME